MKKLARTAALFLAIGAVMYAGGLVSVAPAQVKDKDKKDTTKAKTADVGVTEVYKAKDGWRFRIKNSEGKSIAIGVVGFDTKDEAVKTVDLVKETLNKGKRNILEEKK